MKKQTIALILLSIVSINLISPPIYSYANNKNTSTSIMNNKSRIKNSKSENIHSQKVITYEYENNDIQSIIKNKDGSEDIIYFDAETQDMYLNNEKISQTEVVQEKEARLSWVLLLKTTYNLPIGMTLGAAATAISIYTGIPASKISQMLLSLGCISLGALDQLVSTYKEQYRSSTTMIPPQYTRPVYKYRNKTRTYLTKTNKTITTSDYEFFADRPY